MNPWHAFYPGDYLRDTAHLSLTEHGAYRLFLDHYYSTGTPLPADKSALHRIARAFDERERAAVDSVISQFFELQADGYHNTRADKELARRAEQHARLSSGAKKALRNRWAGYRQPNSLAIARPQPQPQKTKTHTAPSAPGVCEQAVALWNENRGPLPEVLKLTEGRRRKILARLKASPEFLEVLSAATRKAIESPFCCGNGSRGWRANFDWMVANDNNAVKVLEGTYDGQAAGKGATNHAEQRTQNNLRAAGFIH